MEDNNQNIWATHEPYGLSHFKKFACLRYSVKAPNSLLSADKIQCCIKDCEEWLPIKREGQERHFCSRHKISMSTSRAYIFQNHERNFIVGNAILKQIIKVESGRLGNETSEDAVSWNVFVGLFVLNGLSKVFELLTGIRSLDEPELYLWGNRIGSDPVQWKELQRVRNKLESRKGTPTEPDIILRLPGKAIVLIEAKFGSKNGTLDGKAKHERFGSTDVYLNRYCQKDGEHDPLNRHWIKTQPSKNILEQLCRNVIFAQWLASEGEQPFVINLVRHNAINDEELFRQHLSGEIVKFKRFTWENIYGLPIIHTEPAFKLRRYFENKSLRLSPAFELCNAKSSS